MFKDFINWGKSQGNCFWSGSCCSAAGSIVAYVLNITDLDPLKYGLLFERFLNSDRGFLCPTSTLIFRIRVAMK
ncbi:hypothetical protein KOY48_03610 [Candidatus Minimicrobia naudis]|uniref:Bacterial DNA polymerase III alpha subunit NTPase domain-containing protein n=1 Tax=Candidatus Minimicrobia naudis TaxID=2841263 RepID=A0A8F1MBD1_9BACT|nr:hypothetical protein KOY48_03610 [Candidatus Minimicrobia naudis]